ncbi:hypothetical protein BOX15_Mlig029212g3, partial [Macrostomum lignano]
SAMNPMDAADPLTRTLLSLQSAISASTSAAAAAASERRRPRKSELHPTAAPASMSIDDPSNMSDFHMGAADFDDVMSTAAASASGEDAAARRHLSNQLLSSGRMKQTGRSVGKKADVVRASDLIGFKKFSGHMLWLRVQKARLAEGGGGGDFGAGGGGAASSADFAAAGEEQQVDKRKLQQLWQYLPEKEKRQWNVKASRLMRQAARIGAKSFGADASPRQLADHRAVEAVKRLAGERRRLQVQMEKSKLGRFTALDVAAHLKLLGDSLQALGLRLKRASSVSHAGSLDVVTDSLLCALVCLHCLATQAPGIAEAVDVAEAADSLDNCAFFMPGLAGGGGGVEALAETDSPLVE